MNKLRVFEAFAGYGSQSISLRDININHEVIGISEIEPDAIIAYGSIRYNLEDLHTGKSHDEMRKELMDKNVGWDFQKNKSKIPRMKKDKLEMLYKFDKATNNFGDVSIIEPNNLPDFDYFTYSFPCFIEGTKVLTQNGFKNIEDIVENDYVLTHKNRYRKVIKPMINNANHIYRLKTMPSDDLYVTEEHPFYVRKLERVWDKTANRKIRKFSDPKWVKIKDMSKDYYVGIAINNKEELPKWGGSKFEWRDGRKTRYSNILCDKFSLSDFWWIIGRYIGDGWIRHQGGIIICCDFDETEEITNKLENIGFNYSVSNERTANKIHIVFKEIGEYVEQFGRGAKNKRLTGDILNLPKELLKGFLSGYMSADGCFTQGLNKATSISNELIYGIGQCVAKVYNSPFSIYKTERPKTCVIEGRLVNQNSSYSITWKNEKKIQDKAFYEDGYIWCPINGLDKLGYEGLVYNMEVEEDNSYVVQNIICHNCQDISVSGKQSGIEKGRTRSGLLYECEKIIENKKPKYLLMENVKNLVGKKFINDFNAWLEYLESLGYKNYWKVLNAKNYGIAQNRERVFCVSILGGDTFEFPNGFKLEKRLKDFLEDSIEDKYYLSDEIQNRFKQTKLDDGESNVIGTTAPEFRTIGQRDLVYGNESCAIGTLVATDYKQPKQIIDYQNGAIRGRYNENGNIEQQLELRDDGVTNTVTTVQKDNVLIEINEKENFTYNPSGENVIGQMGGDLWEKRHEQTRRVYDIDKVSPTIPTCSGGGQHPKILDEIEHNTICEQRCDEGLRFFKDNVCGTIRTINSGGDKRVIETEPKFRIRKLTPRECLRLMGLSDEDIDRIISTGLSDSSLYKLAGNSIVKQCLDYIHIYMFKMNYSVIKS